MPWRDLTRDSLESTKQHFEKNGQDMQLYAMATEVLLATLGPEWWKTNLQLTSEKPDSFLASDGESETDKLEHQHRVVRLADRLYALRTCEGYEDFVVALKRRSVEATYFELEVAHVLYKSGHLVRFRKETGVKEDDYDLSAQIGETHVAVEAKSRRLLAITDENALKNALKNAREQLPKKGPGVIFIAIPAVWTQQPDAELKIGETISAFFRNTERVNHVVLHWNTWERIQEKHAAVLRFRQYDNNQRRHPFFYQQIVTPLRGPIPNPSFWLG